MGYNPNFPPGKTTAVNVRTIQGLDIWKLEVNRYIARSHRVSHNSMTKPLFRYNGKENGPPYTPPKYSGPEPTAEIEGAKLYMGSCHCGAVTACIKIKPLDSTYPDRIAECNCSNCQRVRLPFLPPLMTASN